MADVKVSHLKGETDVKRALRILLACPRCREMAQTVLDAAKNGQLDPDHPIGIVPCPDCGAKYASGSAH